MKFTINITAENKPGVLYRIANLFFKRKINIERINAFAVKGDDVSKIFLTIEVEKKIIETLVKQINKIIEVKEIKYHKTTH